MDGATDTDPVDKNTSAGSLASAGNALLTVVLALMI
jgi:hypothetical protein